MPLTNSEYENDRQLFNSLRSCSRPMPSRPNLGCSSNWGTNSAVTTPSEVSPLSLLNWRGIHGASGVIAISGCIFAIRWGKVVSDHGDPTMKTKRLLAQAPPRNQLLVYYSPQ